MEDIQQYPLTFGIIALTVVISLIAFSNTEVKNKALFYPYGMSSPSEYYRFISHGFIHADFIHLFFNMFALYSFGSFIEMYLFNKTEYIVLYFTSLIAASVFDFIKNRNNSSYAALGASGAVSAVIFASMIFDPWVKGVALFGVLALPNIVFGVLYLWYCAYMSKRGGDNIGHNAHFWGSVYGFAYTAILKPELFKGFIEKLLHPTF
ncbi:rhomboid family intramembrane serine protease [Ferruginibacter sp.]